MSETTAGLWLERSGDGPPLVLLHGAGMDSRLWDGVVDQLAATHTVIRYDARGLGRSSTPARPYSDVEDLAAVLDHCSLGTATLVGLSMGGECALDFALAYPHRITSLVLIGSSISGWSWPATPDLDAYAAARRDRDATHLADLELRFWASMGATAPGGALIETMVRDNAERRLVSESFATFPADDAVDRLAEMNWPTLIVDSDRDHPETRRIAAHLSSGIRAARRTTIAEADHYLPLRTPHLLVREIESFRA